MMSMVMVILIMMHFYDACCGCLGGWTAAGCLAGVGGWAGLTEPVMMMVEIMVLVMVAVVMVMMMVVKVKVVMMVMVLVEQNKSGSLVNLAGPMMTQLISSQE